MTMRVQSGGQFDKDTEDGAMDGIKRGDNMD